MGTDRDELKRLLRDACEAVRKHRGRSFDVNLLAPQAQASIIADEVAEADRLERVAWDKVEEGKREIEKLRAVRDAAERLCANLHDGAYFGTAKDAVERALRACQSTAEATEQPNGTPGAMSRLADRVSVVEENCMRIAMALPGVVEHELETAERMQRMMEQLETGVECRARLAARISKLEMGEGSGTEQLHQLLRDHGIEPESGGIG